MSDQAVIRHDIGQHGVLELRTVSGTIRIQGTDSSEAVVIVKGEDRALRELNVERGDGRLLVQPQRIDSGLFRRSNVDVDFVVLDVPRDARIDIKGVSTDITGQYLGGEQDYKLVSGCHTPPVRRRPDDPTPASQATCTSTMAGSWS